MKKTLYIHIGFFRTGTTALQVFLRNNREALATAGFLYPRGFAHDRTCHHKLYWFLFPENTESAKKKLFSNENIESNFQALMDEFVHSGARSLIISSELFSNHKLKLEKLGALFEGFEVKIVVYLRKQDDFLLSMYNQVVKNNNFCGSFTDFCNEFKSIINNLDYFEFLNRWETTFGKNNIIVRTYEENDFFGGTIFDDFIKILGISDKLNTFALPKIRLNVSLPYELIEIKRVANSIGLPDDRQKKISKLLNQVNDSTPHKKYVQSQCCDTKWENLIEKWNVSNKKVAHRFFTGRAELFHEPPDIKNLSAHLDNNQNEMKRLREALCSLNNEQLVELMKIFTIPQKNFTLKSELNEITEQIQIVFAERKKGLSRICAEETPGPASHSEYSRLKKKQTLLFVDYAVPMYDKFAGSRTNFMYLKLLVKMGFKVKFLPADFQRREPYSAELSNLGIEVLEGKWYRMNWKKWLQKNGNEIDYVFFHKPDPTIKFLDAVKKYTHAAIIYQCHDLHYLRIRREAQLKNDRKLYAESEIYKKKEDLIFSRSDALLTFSEMEGKIIKKNFPHKHVAVVPLFFYENVPSPERDFKKRRNLLFVGSSAHMPNCDAVSWFCNAFLPIIRRDLPDVTFNVVGANYPNDISVLKRKQTKFSNIFGKKYYSQCGVNILGKVSDEKLIRLYNDARLVVVPLRFGAGVKGKVIEAMYYGVPIVSTSIGLEGIRQIDQLFTPYDDPARFSAQVVSLYKNSNTLTQLSKRGSLFVKEMFSQEKTVEMMNGILCSAKKNAEQRIKVNVSSSAQAPQKKPRLIAFYLPQYHPIPENDHWWGKGFTEWRNVTRAKSLFPDHYQPHIPADLGFYDLRVEETRIAQAQMAKTYGIYGFCYYHYWFNGKRLLERPLEDMLRSGRPDFPFCLCWANENWTRRWDGEEHQILMKMTYSQDDDRRHIRALFKTFEDYRYIRINGKPLFMVYRTENLPEPERTADIWREEVRKAGIGELYLCRVESIGQCDPYAINFDASLEFAPDWNNKGPRVRVKKDKLANINNNMKIDGRPIDFGVPDLFFEKNYVHYYDTLAKNMLNKPVPAYKWFRCVTPSWDNTARRQEGAHVFVGSDPEKYKNWLKQTIKETSTRLFGDEKIVFINAWNEWAEGNHLEPDIKNGHDYLKATCHALKESEEITKEFSPSVNNKKIDQFAIIVGAMKSGTTAIFSLLEQHPTICGCRIKEPEFFLWNNYNQKSMKSYFELWDFDPNLHKYALEASTAYTKLSTHGNVAETISKSGIDARFIYIMRHPIHRIESYLRMASKMGYKLYNKHNQFIPLMYSLYYFQIIEYYKRFPSENILLLSFEEFKENPAFVVKKVCKFLKIDSSYCFNISKMNKHDSKRYLRHVKALTIDSLLSRSEKEKMKAMIRNDMRLLEQELGFDISHWEL